MDRQHFFNFANANNLQFDNTNCVVYGNYRGYNVCINKAASGMVQIVVNVNLNGGPFDKNNFLPLQNAVKEIKQVDVSNRGGIVFFVKSSFTAGATAKSLQIALDKSVEYMYSGGFRNTCYGCMQEKATAGYAIGDACLHLCDDCERSYIESFNREQQGHAQKAENIPIGAVGALFGSLLGVACIVLLGQLGYVAALSGVVLAIFTLKGYAKLAGKMSKIGAVISVVIMIAMVFFGNHLDWSISVANELNFSIPAAFMVLPQLLEQFGLTSDYYTNAAMIGGFALLGAFSPVKAAFTNPTGSKQLTRLNTAAYANAQNSGV